MKTLRKMKKGFTIVELVIVIAVIAVLTAILVPTFISISNKANEASDKSLVKNLNTALRMAEGDQGKKNNTMHDAVLDVEEYAGIKLSQFISRTGDEILWDSVADEFVWKTAKPEGRADYLLWTIVQSYSSSNQTFSMYAGHEWSPSTTTVSGLEVGFDVGFNSRIENISYVGNATAKTVKIRTNNSNLTINAPADSVEHYANGDILTLTAVANSSYHEFGTMNVLKATSGHIVIENGGSVNELQINVASASEVSNISLDVSSNGSLGYVTVAPGANAGEIATAVGESGSLHIPTGTPVVTSETINAVAIINGSFVNSLPTAMTKAAYGTDKLSIRMLKSVENPWGFIYGFDVATIDLNGFTITLTENDGFGFTEVGTIILKDSTESRYGLGKGLLKTTASSDGMTVLVNSFGSNIILESGTLSCEGTDMPVFGAFSGGYSFTMNGGLIIGGNAPIEKGFSSLTLYLNEGEIRFRTSLGFSLDDAKVHLKNTKIVRITD